MLYRKLRLKKEKIKSMRSSSKILVKVRLPIQHPSMIPNSKRGDVYFFCVGIYLGCLILVILGSECK
ncbi:hypothetical protein V6Z11_D05G200000 [Gossypium hirsutum]